MRRLALLVLVLGCLRQQGPARPASGGRAAPDLEQLLVQMTLDEKLGQLTQPDHGALRKRPQDVRELAIGSVLSGGDSLPDPNTLQAWADMYDRYQSLALETRLRIPLIYGVDAVHGHNGLRGAVVFPHNIGLGCTRNPTIVEAAARVTAVEVAATGIDWTFAPCIAVPRDERWGRTYEGFGETPELAVELGAAAVRGLQTANLRGPTAVLACAKHYLGDGGTTGGKDQGDTRATDQELRRIHLPGYAAAVKAGVGSIMVSFSKIDGVAMHGHKRLITELLKGELGFAGFVVSDWDGIDKIPGDYAAKVAAALDAGIDLFMVPNKYRQFIETARRVVQEGRVPISRIDDAVRRILRQKAALGLWERPLADRALMKEVGGRAHRSVARQAVRESLVLLKNERGALPIARTVGRIHVAGSRADDIGAQCGGWCVSWQGKRGAITPGTTILQAIRRAVPHARVTFSADGGGGADAEIAVAVLGEDPYAEGKGDRQDLALTADDQALLSRLRESGRKLVVVLLTGRPLVLGSVLSHADALVVAWLPGTEGDGVADVLFGDHRPTGKLSHSWPRTAEQIPINQGDAPYDPLFPYGFGLTY